MIGFREISSETVFIDEAWELVYPHEGLKPKVYADHKGIPTIGAGFNLSKDEPRKATLKALGLEVEIDRTDASDEELIEIGYIDEINTILDRSYNDVATLQSDLDAVMMRRANDTGYLANSSIIRRSSFSFSHNTDGSVNAAGTAEMREAFDGLFKHYDDQIDTWINDVRDGTPLEQVITLSIPQSHERISLFSLAYNGLLHKSHQLKEAIQTEIFEKGDGGIKF